MLGETPAYKTSLLSWAIAALLVVVAASGTALVMNNTNGMLSASGNDSGTDPVESDSTHTQDSVEDEITPTTGEEEEPSTSLTVSDVSFAFESLNFSGSEDFSFTLEDEEGTVYEISGDQVTQEVTVTATSDDGTVETERMSMEEFMIMMEEEEEPCAEEDEDDWPDEEEDERSEEDEEDWSDEDEDEGSDEDEEDWSDEDEDEGSDEDEEDWSDEDEDEGADEDEEVLSITMNFETEEVTITYVDEDGNEQTETVGLEEFMDEMEDEEDPCADEDDWSDEDEDERSEGDEDSEEGEEVLRITMNFETEEVTITYVDENGDEQTETVGMEDFFSTLEEEWFEEDEDADDEEDDWFDDEEESENEEDDSAEEDASTESEDVR